MFAASKTTSPSGGTPDPQFNYVTMLLHGDGTNGAQNNTFLDSSTNNFTITRNGNTTQGSFSPYGSNWSNYFDGSTDWFSVADNSALDFDAGDLTAEAWIYLSDATVVNTVVAKGFASAGGWMLWVQSTLRFRMYDASGSSITAISSASLTSNSWNHVAATRSGNTLTVYINGVSSGTATFSGTSTNSAALEIGAYNSGNGNLAGYISNLRLVKGTAVYTVNFTPSTTPLTAVSGTSLLTCQSNRFIDNSANNFTLTKTGDISVQRFNPFGASTAYSTSVIGGSGYFDGSGDWLEVSTNSAFNISSGDFTMEAWVYYTSRPSSNVMSINSGSGVDGIYYLHGANPAVYVASGGGWNIMSQDVSSYLPLNCWNHTALVRNGDLWRIYINGVSVYSTTNSSSISFSTTPLRIGASGGGSQPTFGYIADARLVKGTAVYTGSTYTVPTAPLTAITNTSLLAKMTNGAIFDNAMMNDLETVGNAQISTSVVKYGTGSLYFDGTGDYLLGPSAPNMSFGAGNFTVEMWVYRQVTGGTNQGLYQKGYTGGTNLEFTLSIDTSNRPVVYVTTDGSTLISILTSSTTMSQNTWTHLAVTRSGSSWRLFVDGTQTNSATDSSTLYTGNGQISVGANPVGVNPFTGYIDDLRITKGYARYTANFTPPTAAFPNTGPI